MSEAESKKVKPGQRAVADWAAIERDYRLGQLTVREIARQHEINPSSIIRRAERDGWARDLSDEVRAKTRAALLRNTPSATPERNTPTREDIALAVQTNVQLVREHRADIKALRDAVTKLIADLSTELDPEEVIETLSNGDPDEVKDIERKLNRALALGGRAQAASTLANTLKVLIPLEREAFALDAKPDQGEAINVDLTEKSLAKLARFLG